MDLRTYFFTKRGIGKAVDGVSFELRRGETLGLVGESGSGKTVTALSIVGLNPKPASRIVGGRVIFGGEDLVAKTQRELTQFRGRHIATIFQDPMSALNPVLTVGEQIFEVLRLHRKLRGQALRDEAVRLLTRLNVPDAARRLDSYPHQFSGGMRQRVIGAIALASGPEVLIADEPTTSLDVTIEAAYLALLRDLQAERGLAILFITHDFGVVSRVCDRVAVMYAGRVVETASVAELLVAPAHPYTAALLKSVPDMRRPSMHLVTIQGQPPPVTDFPSGCRFHPRCWLYERLGKPENCRSEEPQLRAVVGDQVSACHYSELTLRRTPEMHPRTVRTPGHHEPQV